MSTSGTSGTSGASGPKGHPGPTGPVGSVKLPENIQESGSSGVSSFVEDKTIGSGYCVDATNRPKVSIGSGYCVDATNRPSVDVVGSGYCVDATNRPIVVVEDSVSGNSGNSGSSGKSCCKPCSGYSSHSGCLDSFHKESGYSGRRKKRSLFRWFLDLFTK